MSADRPSQRRGLRSWARANLAFANTPAAWRERISAVLWLSAAAGLAIYGSLLLVEVQYLLWGMLALILAGLFRGGWLRLLGPVLIYDLVRLARRRRYVLIRSLYAVLLLLLLISLYVYWSWNLPAGVRLRGAELTRFAEQFFLTFMAAEFLIVVLLTPAYTGGAIAEEKDRGTLDYLLATDLRNREIVLSKLAARLANLLLIVLVGLPILSLSQFFGGIDPTLVLTGFAALGVTTASLACLSILTSTYARKARDAIVMAYLVLAAYLGFSYLLAEWSIHTPAAAYWGFIWEWDLWNDETWSGVVSVAGLVDVLSSGNLFIALQKLWQGWEQQTPLAQTLPALLRDYTVFHAVVALLCAGWAVARVRAVAMKQAGQGTRAASRWAWFGTRRRPPVGDEPMIWKELHAEREFQVGWIGRFILVALGVLSFVPAAMILFDAGTALPTDPVARQVLGDAMGVWARWTGSFVACLALVGVAVRAAVSVSGERDRQTLDGLLTTPMSRDVILHGKWLGSILSMRWALVWLGLVWTLGVLTGGLHPLALPLLIAAWIVLATFTANLGLYFSITSANSLRSMVFTLLGLVFVGFGHWLVWSCCLPFFIYSSDSRNDFPAWVASFQTYAMTPPFTLYVLAFQGPELRQPMFVGYREMNQTWERFLCGTVGIACWGVASLVLGWVNGRRFRLLAGGPLHGYESPVLNAYPLSYGLEPVETHEVPEPVDEPIKMALPVAETPASGAVLIDEDEGEARGV